RRRHRQAAAVRQGGDAARRDRVVDGHRKEPPGRHAGRDAAQGRRPPDLRHRPGILVPRRGRGRGRHRLGGPEKPRPRRPRPPPRAGTARGAATTERARRGEPPRRPAPPPPNPPVSPPAPPPAGPTAGGGGGAPAAAAPPATISVAVGPSWKGRVPALIAALEP